jgi:hypothetical protein
VVPEDKRQITPTSKWSDPNHPMFTGGLVGLVSGGYIDAGKYRAEKRERKLQRKELRFERRYGSRTQYSDSQSPSQGFGRLSLQGSEQQATDYFNRSAGGRTHPRAKMVQRGGGPGGVIGAVKKIMQEDVLYLMIVPMPSEAELAEAREMLRMEKEKK